MTKKRFVLAVAALLVLLPGAFSHAEGNASDGAASAEPIYATVGAVGDIIVMDGQSAGAYDDATGAYDFARSFAGMADCLSNVDLMCGNLEVPLAGEKYGYTQRQRNKGPTHVGVLISIGRIASDMREAIPAVGKHPVEIVEFHGAKDFAATRLRPPYPPGVRIVDAHDHTVIMVAYWLQDGHGAV